MSLYFLDAGGSSPSLHGALRSWLSRNPYNWQLRQAEPGPADLISPPWALPAAPLTRRAEPREVAEALLADPVVEAALKALGSPAAQHIEYAVAAHYLPPADAQLLTDALHLALSYVTDASKPLWKRADVLIGVGAAVTFAIVIIAVTRNAGGGAPPAA